jgi:L-fuconolactonase
MYIDAHQHFWRYEPAKEPWITDTMRVIKRDFLPADLEPILTKHNFEGCVAVQADQSEHETHSLLFHSDHNDFIKGVVGWVDLMSPDLRERLDYFSQFEKLKGIRHIIQSEPSGFMLQPEFIRGVKILQEYNLTYDLLIYHHQLEEALLFVQQFPNLKIVIDHMAKPSIKTKEKTHWELNMAAMATFENVHCKISGMVTEAEWSSWKVEDFFPYLDELFESFGPSRLLYGSDWPVCLLAATYDQQLEIVQQHLSPLTNNEKLLVMGENARRFYNL